MTQTAARHGYKDASVAWVVEQAGVSRATFYEHFADKEACFLAAFEAAAERIEIALPRVEAEYSPALRAGELLEDLLVNIVSGPAAARILLVEALAGGPEVRRAHERFMRTVEATFERWLEGPGENGYRLAISGRAIMEGIRHPADALLPRRDRPSGRSARRPAGLALLLHPLSRGRLSRRAHGGTPASAQLRGRSATRSSG